MPHINSNRRTFAATAVVVPALLLACLGLAACGGSSSSSSTSTSAKTSTSGSAAHSKIVPGSIRQRFRAASECLQKAGITLPNPVTGAGPQLPKGMTRAQYEAAYRKCVAGSVSAGRGGARFDNPTYRATLTKFAACMRENGVNVPVPDTSGKGPIFDTKGIDTASTQFKAAETKCSGDLRNAFHRAHTGGVAPGAPAPGGAPAG